MSKNRLIKIALLVLAFINILIVKPAKAEGPQKVNFRAYITPQFYKIYSQEDSFLKKAFSKAQSILKEEFNIQAQYEFIEWDNRLGEIEGKLLNEPSTSQNLKTIFDTLLSSWSFDESYTFNESIWDIPTAIVPSFLDRERNIAGSVDNLREWSSSMILVRPWLKFKDGGITHYGDPEVYAWTIVHEFSHLFFLSHSKNKNYMSSIPHAKVSTQLKTLVQKGYSALAPYYQLSNYFDSFYAFREDKEFLNLGDRCNTFKIEKVIEHYTYLSYLIKKNLYQEDALKKSLDHFSGLLTNFEELMYEHKNYSDVLECYIQLMGENNISYLKKDIYSNYIEHVSLLTESINQWSQPDTDSSVSSSESPYQNLKELMSELLMEIKSFMNEAKGDEYTFEVGLDMFAEKSINIELDNSSINEAFFQSENIYIYNVDDFLVNFPNEGFFLKTDDQDKSSLIVRDYGQYISGDYLVKNELDGDVIARFSILKE